MRMSLSAMQYDPVPSREAQLHGDSCLCTPSRQQTPLQRAAEQRGSFWVSAHRRAARHKGRFSMPFEHTPTQRRAEVFASRPQQWDLFLVCLRWFNSVPCQLYELFMSAACGLTKHPIKKSPVCSGKSSLKKKKDEERVLIGFHSVWCYRLLIRSRCDGKPCRGSIVIAQFMLLLSFFVSNIKNVSWQYFLIYCITIQI